MSLLAILEHSAQAQRWNSDAATLPAQKEADSRCESAPRQPNGSASAEVKR